MLAVRKQESELARQSSKSFRSQKSLESKQDSLVIPTQDKARAEKLEEISQLKQKLDFHKASLGKAQAEAQQEEIQLEQARKAKEQYMKEAETRAKHRGEQALRSELEANQRRIEEENYLKDRKAEIMQKEYEIAKEVAQKNRERQALIEEERKKEEILNYVRPGGTLVYGKIDYSKTHFHNPVILVHDIEGKNALELANEEHLKDLERFETQQEMKSLNDAKAKNRGQQALIELAVKKDLERLAKELEKVRKADGENKIERGQSDPTLQNRCITKMTQDYVRKQQRLEQAFENIFLDEVEEDIGEKYQVKSSERIRSAGRKDSDKGEMVVHEIPMPINENKAKEIEEGDFERNEDNSEVHEFDDSRESNRQAKVKKGPLKQDLKESHGFANKYLVNKKPETIESDSESEKLELSLSEEENPMPAKYIPKPNKKPKKSSKTLKKNESLSIKKPENKSKPDSFDEHGDQFKDNLDEDYKKHIQIKKKIEELKKFSTEPKKIIEPPSVLSSQISPESYPKAKETKTNSNPAKIENFGLYSKIKDELGAEKSAESSIDETANDPKSKNFLEEMKIKYGIQSSSKKSEVESQASSKKDEKNPIFSDRTLKLMKEIEEKYSLDKYKIKDDDEEDLRYTLPFAKNIDKPSSPKFTQQKFEHEDSESEENPKSSNDLSQDSHSLDKYESQEDYEKYQFKPTDMPFRDFGKSQSEEENSNLSDVNIELEQIRQKYLKSEKIHEDLSKDSEDHQASRDYYKSQDYENYEISESQAEVSDEEDLKPRDSKPSQSSVSQDLEDEGKFSFNEKFFSDLKEKYGFASKGHNENDKISEQSEESPLPPKLSKKQELVVDDIEAKGKSLADIFKERNQKAMNKINERENSLTKGNYKEKSKDELKEVRKDLMKSKVEKSEEVEEKKANPVLDRLGKGEKPKISKKEMHDLTKKNYELLPEVKKKREEERKRQELKERIQKSKEFEKVRNI